MFIGRKAVQSHIIIIFLLSIVLSVFLLFVLKGFYGEEHEFCQRVNFAVDTVCKDGTNAKITVVNEAGSITDLNLIANGDISEVFYFEPKEQKEIKVSLRDVSSIELVPVIKTVDINYCNGKSQKISVGTLTGC